MIDLTTRLVVSAASYADAPGEASLHDIVTGASGDGTKALFGDGTFKTPGGGSTPRFLPFFGDTSLLWQRPSLNIGGPSDTFNTWLNQGGQAVGIGTDGNFSNGNPVAPGTGYAPGDISTLAGGTLRPDDAYHFPAPATHTTVEITDTTVVVIPTIVSAGSGGTPGAAQVIGTTGGPSQFVLDVTIGMDGSIASIDDINQGGDYNVGGGGNPAALADEPVADNSSSGITGVSVNLTGCIGALLASVHDPGVYTSPPSNPVSETSSSGSGTGATWDLLYSDDASATDGVDGLPLIVDADSPWPSSPGGGTSVKYLSALLTPIGSPPWTISCGEGSIFGNSNSNSDPETSPLILYNSSTDQAIELQWVQDNGLYWFSFHYNTVSGLANGGAEVSHVASGNLPFAYFGWFQIENDGTNLIFRLSGEGLVFKQFYTETLAGFIESVDYIGYGVNRAQTGNAPDGALAILWNWVETSP